MELLLDTNVLVGLLNPRDQWHEVATADMQRLQTQRLRTTVTVLAEVCYHLQATHYRLRLESLLHTYQVEVLYRYPRWSSVMTWLLDYEEHRPDWVDAEIAVLSWINKSWRVWTYDSDFWKIWRRPDGTRIPLAVSPRA